MDDVADQFGIRRACLSKACCRRISQKRHGRNGRTTVRVAMSVACLSLGSNLEPERHLRAAIAALRARFDAVRVSSTYRTAAIGFDGPDFLNAAAVIATDLGALELDAWLHALEDAHGRDRSGPRFGSRTLDLDLILYDDMVLDGLGHLRLPRDELRHAFVLRPLAEIAPDVMEPRSGLTLSELWSRSPERGTPMTVVDMPESSGDTM